MIQDALRDLTDDGRGWVQLGTIDSIEVHAAFGVLLNCTVQPDGGECQARLVAWASGPSSGAYPRVQPGDEVVLLFAGGNRNRAVAIVGLSSLAATPPESWGDGDHIEFCDANGVRIRRTEGATAQAVVTEALLADLKASLNELQIGLLAVAAAVPTAPPVVTQTIALIAQLDTLYRSQALKTE